MVEVHELGGARRILVAGTSGSGKTTLACRLSTLLEIPHTEIDGLYHGPEWTPRLEFKTEVATLVAQPAWITEWQYHTVRELLLSRAELLIFLDYPRWLVMSRVVRRTVRRSLNRELLWNGNVEPPLHSIFTSKENIIRWAWTSYPKNRDRIVDLDNSHPALPIVHLGSPRETERWLDAMHS